MEPRRGSTFIDLLVSMAILTLLFGAIFLTYYSILSGSANVEGRTEAASVVNRELEIIRNLPYDKIGTQGGIPAGILPQEQTVNFGAHAFTLRTTVRNVDDPFDGTLGGSPNDTAPADYKLVQFEISCSSCESFRPFNLVSTFAPKNLESSSSTGSLFVNVFDAAGQPISAATVRIVNTSTAPSIDLTDVTDAAGVLQLVGVPTSTQSYQVFVSKAGYSSENTYPIGGASNPNPVKPHATVAAQTVTNVSFAVDRLSTLNVRTSNEFCAPVANVDFTIAGSKLIGTSPDVLKYPSTSSVTDANGVKSFAGLEWDAYAISLTEAGYDIAGTSDFLPYLLNPSSTADARFILKPADAAALLVTVKDQATGQGIRDAQVILSRSGFTETRTTARSSFDATTWSGGAYASASADIDPSSSPGSITLEANSSGTYPLATQWLESNTVDFGGASTTLYEWSWIGNTPAGAGADSIKFQFAANDDGASWNYIGPDGTGATYYTAASTTLHTSLNGRRYFRYKAYLTTADETETPRLDSVSMGFGGICVPPYQVLFQNLGLLSFDVSVSASGYVNATSSVTLSANYSEVVMQLNRP